ncbi:MAG: hypothetical protein WBF33_25675 [Candidatus Nitrosopolaris sp.]
MLRVILVTKRSRTAIKGFAKAKEDNGMMNIKDVISPGEEVLFGTQQHRFVPGGKETSPGQIFVTTERVIIETSKWLGLKKEYQDLQRALQRYHECCIEEEHLEQRHHH